MDLSSSNYNHDNFTKKTTIVNKSFITESDINRAIKDIGDRQPDLILLDVIMPQMSGFEVCSLLKSSPTTKDIPIIFLTALDNIKDQIQGIELGAFDYITKPIKLSELLARVTSCFRILQLNYDLQVQNSFLKAEIVAKEKAKLALKKSEKTLRTIINNDFNGMIIVDQKGNILFLNQRAEKLFNRSHEDMVGDNLGIPLKIHAVSELEILRSSQEFITVEMRCVPIIWNNNHAYLITVSDITERKKMEEKLNILFQASEQSPASILITDTSGIIEYVNPKFQNNSGYTKKEVLGKNITLFKSKYTNELEYKKLWQTIKNGQEWQGEFKNKKKGGDIYWEKVLISPIFNEVGTITHYIAVSEDITEQKEEKINLQYQAKYDNLTKIPNRNYGLEKVNYLLQQAKENHSQLGLMFVDLDHFKQVNDNLGHDYGDELLIQATQRMKNALRNTDLIARLGGDEFFIAIPFVEKKSDLETIAAKIIKVLNQCFMIFQDSVFISGSIGIAIFPQDGNQLKQLIRKADLAMYQSKTNGKNQFHFYTSQMDQLRVDTLNVQQNFYQAIVNNELKIVYQPVIEINSQKIVSAEALVRWENKELGLIYPQEFIPLVEKNGMILDLETWLLESILKDVQIWQKIKIIPISINISEYQFKDQDLFERLRQFVTKHDNFSEQIQIEIKEEMLLERKYLITKMMLEISKLNINLCLDNFEGTFSSLAQLNKLKIKCLKIDQSLIHQLQENQQIELLVKSIIALAKVLDIKTVAKGIETQEQFDTVKELKCDYAQGYFFSQPLSSINLLTYLTKDI